MIFRLLYAGFMLYLAVSNPEWFPEILMIYIYSVIIYFVRAALNKKNKEQK